MSKHRHEYHREFCNIIINTNENNIIILYYIKHNGLYFYNTLIMRIDNGRLSINTPRSTIVYNITHTFCNIIYGIVL